MFTQKLIPGDGLPFADTHAYVVWRGKNTLSPRGCQELLIRDNERQLALHDVNPLVLIAVPPRRAGASSGRLENAHSATVIPP